MSVGFAAVSQFDNEGGRDSDLEAAQRVEVSKYLRRLLAMGGYDDNYSRFARDMNERWKLKIDPGVVSKWMNGKRQPSAYHTLCIIRDLEKQTGFRAPAPLQESAPSSTRLESTGGDVDALAAEIARLAATLRVGLLSLGATLPDAGGASLPDSDSG